MALHKDTPSMLRESLQEYLKVAEYCVEFRKDPNEWGSGGCYGYPAAVMLFCIVDSIGSFHDGKLDFKVMIDGREKSIRNGGSQYFYVLNSKYYQQSLSGSDIDRLYYNYRSLLMHSGAMAFDHFLISDPNIHEPFPVRYLIGREVRLVNLFCFLEISRNAVSLFLNDIDQIVPGSKQAEDIKKKR